MKRKIILLSILLFSANIIWSQSFNYLPLSKNKQVVSHSYLTLSYLEEFEQAEWVAYELSKERVGGAYRRSNDFRADPKVGSGSAELSDYKGSGYDRGHLAPAADMKFDETAMTECFFMSNMSPQDPSFNRGIWKNLEAQVREWAIQNEHLYIVTGPILDSSLTASIGSNKVVIPNFYYKVILDYTTPEVKGIAFVLPNEKGVNQLTNYVVTIDHVESLTGIDFFPELPDDLEQLLESRKDISRWSFIPLSISNTKRASNSAQCLGKASSTGIRCLNRTKIDNGYCHVHQAQVSGVTTPTVKKKATASRCTATTKAGGRCKRNTQNANRKCWQHQ